MKLHHYAYNIVRTIKKGWDAWNWVFYIGGISTIIGGYFKLAGVASLIVALAFFYFMGKFHEHAENAMQA